MPISSKQIAAVLTVALLAACQGTPKQAPQATPGPEPVDATIAADSTPELVTAPAAGPPTQSIDRDQLAYEDAIAALKSDHALSARILLDRLSRDAPDKPRLFTNLGLAHFRLQEFEPAEQAFRQAIERDPDDAVAHNHLGILQRRKGEFQHALQAYQKAIDIDAKYARAHLNLGILFDLYLQDLEKALQQYRRYQELTSEENTQVGGWILDIERRLKTNSKQTQG